MLREPHNCPSNHLIGQWTLPSSHGFCHRCLLSRHWGQETEVTSKWEWGHSINLRTAGRELTEKQSRVSAIVKGFVRRMLMNSIMMGASSDFLQALNSWATVWLNSASCDKWPIICCPSYLVGITSSFVCKANKPILDWLPFFVGNGTHRGNMIRLLQAGRVR